MSASIIYLGSKTDYFESSTEERAKALVGYAEAYKIFQEFDPKHLNMQVCLANMGSISMQEGEYW